MSKQSTTQEQQARVLARKRREGTSQGPRPQTAPDQANADVTTLQRTLGNQTVGQMLGGSPVQRQPGEARSLPHDLGQIMARPVAAAAPTIQRKGPRRTAPASDPQKQKEIADKIRDGQQKRHEAQHGWFGSQTRLGQAAGWMGWGRSTEEDKKETSSLQVGAEGKKEEELKALDQEKQLFGEKEAEEEKTDETWKELLVKKLTINLAEVENAELLKGSAKGGIKANAVEGLQGEGEVEWQWGKSGKLVKDQYDFLGKQEKLKASSEVAGFAGAKGGAKAEASAKYDKEKGFSAAAGGKASAFAGASLEGKTDIVLKMGDKDVIKTTGKVGVTVGVGGEVEIKVSWEGGEFKASGNAKLAAGLGFELGYNISINVPTIASSLWSWASSFWSTSTGGQGAAATP